MKEFFLIKPFQLGFSLIEVLIALMMLSITITSLLTLQNRLQITLFNDNAQWQAEQLAIQAFVDAEKQKTVTLGKALERQQDDFKIVYTVTPPQEGTPFFELEHLVMEKVVVSWTRNMVSQDVTLIKYAYRPDLKKEPDTKNSTQTVAESSPVAHKETPDANKETPELSAKMPVVTGAAR